MVNTKVINLLEFNEHLSFKKTKHIICVCSYTERCSRVFHFLKMERLSGSFNKVGQLYKIIYT
jgi:hypothetical protein